MSGTSLSRSPRWPGRTRVFLTGTPDAKALSAEARAGIPIPFAAFRRAGDALATAIVNHHRNAGRP